MLLLLTDLTQIQQVMQLEPEPVLHPQEVRKVEDDAKYNPVDPTNANQSEQVEEVARRERPGCDGHGRYCSS